MAIKMRTSGLHDDPNDQHGDSHADTANDHGPPPAPFIHVVHVWECEEIEHHALQTVGEERRRRLADDGLLEEKDGVVHDAGQTMVSKRLNRENNTYTLMPVMDCQNCWR